MSTEFEIVEQRVGKVVSQFEDLELNSTLIFVIGELLKIELSKLVEEGYLAKELKK